MELYLARHGELKPEEEDPARPLSDRGRQEVESAARAVVQLKPPPAAIWHSGKLRAKETAEIFAEHLKPPQGVQQVEGLAPMDDPQVAQRMVEERREPIMLVGHLPHLSRLASLLLVGDAEREIVAFHTGGLVCLSHEEGHWWVRWLRTPELAAV